MNKKISVVTIVYNGESLIEKTILSVINQSYKNLEYLVIDGKSTDNTLEIINKYKANINIISSEKDTGLYDAMNKGQQLSTGDFIIFMNAGDQFYNNQVLENIASINNLTSDIYFGETMFVDEVFKEIGVRSVVTPHKLPKKLNKQNFKYGMVVCHQSIIIRKALCSQFNIKYRFCADIDWILNALEKSNSNINVNMIVSKYLVGGISDKKKISSLIDRFEVFTKHFGFTKTLYAHCIIVVRFFRKINKL